MFIRWKIKKIIKKLKAMQAARKHNQPSAEDLKKEIAVCLELASIYKSLLGNKKFPQAQIMIEESTRLAADLEDPEANYLLGKMLLEQAKFRDKLAKESVFDNDVNSVHTTALYKEAHAYIAAAVNLKHIEAKRLKGLAYINGWGLDTDSKTGFELVVESIEQEGAWDRVPQIFAAIGLNKPEFFSAIMQRKKN